MDSNLLADELVKRLNSLIAMSEGVRKDIGALLDEYVVACEATVQHQTIQCLMDDPKRPILRFLGVINGIVGNQDTGEPRIVAVFNDDDELVSFERNRPVKKVHA